MIVHQHPPVEIDLEHQLDGFTASLPMPVRLPRWGTAALVLACMAIIMASVVVGLVVGLESEGLGLLLVLSSIPLCVGGMIGLDRWMKARIRVVSLRGQRLTLTSGRRQRTLDLTEVAEVDPRGLDIALVLRSGERLILAKGQSRPIQDWLASTLLDRLDRPAIGTPDEVPAAMRALAQKQRQPQ